MGGVGRSRAQRRAQEEADFVDQFRCNLSLGAEPRRIRGASDGSCAVKWVASREGSTGSQAGRLRCNAGGHTIPAEQRDEHWPLGSVTHVQRWLCWASHAALSTLEFWTTEVGFRFDGKRLLGNPFFAFQSPDGKVNIAPIPGDDQLE